MLSEEEKQVIKYLKSRLYGNEGCKFIDVAQSDLRIFLKLVENLQKDIESWKKYCDEQENDITLKNNKICDLEFKIEKQSKEIEEYKKQLDLDNECEIALNNRIMDLKNADKKWEDKIKAKIEELDEEIKVKKEIAKNPMDRVSGRLLTDNIVELEKAKKVLQSLLEKE